ncbi:histidine kinase dimerization/phospho-acceptor domain-containing protein [Marinobacter sp.]|uniref:histidine kinase dimerization/phospho-acceptor domain-containing protein n=1 Tax=Marinobacter sp. TaxID=50741 RepID=UPI00384EB09E
MSLRSRLLAMLSLSLIVLWLTVAILMYLHLGNKVSETLDQRLAASANMVAGLIAQQPGSFSQSFREPLLMSPISEGVACQVRSATGQILMQTAGPRGTSLSDAKPGFTTRSVSGEEWRLYTLEQDGLLITTADRGTERRQLENGIILVMIVPFSLALLGSLVVLWWGVRRGLEPLQKLYRELQLREPSNLKSLSIGNAPAELKPIVNTLNSLFARVERTVIREQRFASNTAHEFRTPLTGIKTHLQVARRIDGEQQQLALARAETGVQRLQNVAEQLLMLARLESRDDWREFEPCSVSIAIREALVDMPGGERVKQNLETEDVLASTPHPLVVIAVRNLLENALKFSSHDQPVELKVSCQLSNHQDMVKLVIRDGGHSPSVSEHGNGQQNSQSPEQGHGLGLTIVESIAEQFNGRLHAERNTRGGMDWELALPGVL